MSTLWGYVQHSTCITPGISWVCTDGHGGLRIRRRFAEANLSSAARQRAIKGERFFWYEEDCDYAVACWELIDKYPNIMQNDKTIEENRAVLLKSLSTWNADYLKERGTDPDPESYLCYLRREIEDTMRRMKRPDLITGALNGEINGVPATTVWTADDKRYIVARESYKPNQLGIYLLSDCILIEESQDAKR